jgi:transcriptional regulator of heat shock response
MLVVVVAEVLSRKAIDPRSGRGARFDGRRTISTPIRRHGARAIARGPRAAAPRATLADAAVPALRLAQSSLEELPRRSPLFVDGASSLLEDAGEDGGVTIGTLHALLKMVEDKERLIRLLNEYIDGPGLTIVIGQEHRTPDLRAFSLVAATYAHGARRGTVGVIGPMRMQYSRTIAVVDGVAQAVSRVLRDSM